MVQIFDIPKMDEIYRPTYKDFRFDKRLWQQIRPLLKEALIGQQEQGTLYLDGNVESEEGSQAVPLDFFEGRV